MILVNAVIVNNNPGNNESAVKKSTIFKVLAISFGFPILSILIVNFKGTEDSLAASTVPVQLNIARMPQTIEIINHLFITLSLHNHEEIMFVLYKHA